MFLGLDIACCTVRRDPGASKDSTSNLPPLHQNPETPTKSPTHQGPANNSSPSRMLKENVKGILVNKAKREMKMGVRVAPRADGNTEGVEVVEVHPSGPLASVILVGDVLLRINGTLCDAGYDAAAIELRDAVGIVELVIIRRSGPDGDSVKTIVDTQGLHVSNNFFACGQGGETSTILVPRASLVAAKDGAQLTVLLNSAFTQATKGEALHVGTITVAYQGRDGSKVVLSDSTTFDEALNPFGWTACVYVSGRLADALNTTTALPPVSTTPTTCMS